MRYKNFSTSQRRDLTEVIELIHEPDNLADFYFANADEYDAIMAIHKATDIDAFKNKYLPLIRKVSEETPTDLIGTTTLYRGVLLGPDEMAPDMEKPGICWTETADAAQDFIYKNVPGNIKDDPNFAECIITADYKNKDIDWLYSIALRLDEPDEREWRIFKDAKPVRIDYEVL